jgi:hypothetical protein
LADTGVWGFRNRAFTYGQQLNRQGLKPIKSLREKMRDHFTVL